MWWQTGSLMTSIPVPLSPRRWKKTVCIHLNGPCNTLATPGQAFKDRARACVGVCVCMKSFELHVSAVGPVSLCVFACAILERCKVRVRVSSTQLSPSELFIKIPNSSFSCYLNIINLAQPGNLKACGGFHSIFVWQKRKRKKNPNLFFSDFAGQNLNVLTVLRGKKREWNPNVLVLVL